MTYRIKTVAEMTGVPRGTLLAWERRYDVPEPGRSASGYRAYSDADVALLKRLKGLVDAGHPIGEAVDIVRSQPRISRGGDLMGAVLRGLLRFDRATVDRLLPDASVLSFERAIDEIHLPVIRRVGELWLRGEASIAQEHFVSGWCREQMLAIFHALRAGPEGGPTVACALPTDDLHELGVLAIAIKLALRGWRVTWLGAQMPAADLIMYARREAPRVLCLSVVIQRPDGWIRAWAEEIRAGAPPITLVVVGGPAVAGMQHLDTPGLRYAATWDQLLEVIG